MSEYDYDDEDSEMQDNVSETRENGLRKHTKLVEKENAALRQQVAEAELTRRELAFMKAGIDPDSPMSKYFVKGYDGELTQEAIRQAAIEAQLISPPNPITQDEEQAWQRTNQAAAGSQTAQPPVDWNRRLEEATSSKEVMAILAEAQNL